jgi:hypothetical protein
MPRRRITTVIALALTLGGCAALVPQHDCAQFEQQRKTTDYGTRYTADGGESQRLAKKYSALPKARLAAAPLYRIDVDTHALRPCTHLQLSKELYLQRSNGEMVIEETREFYAEDGTRIATKTETLGAQLRHTGFYRATVALPIPASAPGGRYRVVSKLMLRTKPAATAQLLAEAETRFEVLPTKSKN